MKIVVSGSRHLQDYDFFCRAVEESGFLLTRKGIECIIQGGATGIDKLSRRYAKENSIPCITREADWEQHGKAAGPIRNSEMIEYVSEGGEKAGLLAIWDGYSRGTFDCIKKAQAKGLVIFIKTLNVVDAAKLRQQMILRKND